MRKRHPQITVKKVFSFESLIFLVIFFGLFGGIASKMGAVNMINTMMNTSYSLLLDTVLYIMAIAVLAGAIAGLLNEFGIVAIVNKTVSPVMKPLYGLPGAGVVGVMATYLSDNPAILTLADDISFKRYFKKYQMPALTNIGTAFGMGLIITTFMIGITPKDDSNFILAAAIGNLGAIIGSIVSVRIMLIFTKREFGEEEPAYKTTKDLGEVVEGYRIIHPGSGPSRALEAILSGGKGGVDIGLSIIPGVLIICTIVMILTNGPSESGAYTGAAYEGVAFLPWIGSKIDFILQPLFGFSTNQAIAVPITALGAAGAAIGLVPKMVESGMATGGDIAVFTSMCMCWSGYLSTHVAMMSALKFSSLTGKSIFAHTIGGICAGVSAHWIYILLA